MYDPEIYKFDNKINNYEIQSSTRPNSDFL